MFGRRSESIKSKIIFGTVSLEKHILFILEFERGLIRSERRLPNVKQFSEMNSSI